MLRRILIQPAILSLFLLAGQPFLQVPKALPFEPFSDDPVSVKSYVELASVPRGGSVKIAIELKIKTGWHINAHDINDPYLIPTSVAVDSIPGVSIQETVYPAGISKKLSFSEKPLILYSGKAVIGLLAGFDRAFPPGDTTLAATVTYQACDDKSCLPPVEKRIRIPITISPGSQSAEGFNPEIFSAIKFGTSMQEAGGEGGHPAGSSSADASTAEGDKGRLQNILETRGMFMVFVLVFIGGLALNLTPCVYPIIPITVSYFGGQSRGRTSRTFLLAALYVLGMAAMYSTLGLMAALTGSMLGTALQNPLVLLFVALVLVALALSMFGLYEIRIPAALSNVAGTSKQGGFGAFLMGLTVGIVAAPCIGPFVLGLLTFVGESGNPVLGFFMFFTLALGLGLPFIALAVVSGSISRLPKSGEWMEWVRKLFGIILVAMAIYFLESLIGQVSYYLLMGILFITGGVFLGFVIRTSTQATFFLILRRFVGITAPLFGLYLILNPGHIIARGGSGGIEWQPFDRALLDTAIESSKPAIIDFYADWCIPCKELDYKTFSHPEVVKEARGVVALKADMTLAFSKEAKALREAYKIKGVPTVVFLDGQGRERTDLRILGFVDKDDFLVRLKKLKGSLE